MELVTLDAAQLETKKDNELLAELRIWAHVPAMVHRNKDTGERFTWHAKAIMSPISKLKKTEKLDLLKKVLASHAKFKEQCAVHAASA